jgi:hypothetical protein
MAALWVSAGFKLFRYRLISVPRFVLELSGCGSDGWGHVAMERFLGTEDGAGDLDLLRHTKSGECRIIQLGRTELLFRLHGL